MTELNHLSDNQILLPSIHAEGSEIEVNPDAEWMKIHLRCGDRNFVAVNDPAMRKNCHLDENGKLVIDIPSNSFRAGEVEYLVEIREDSEYFRDGYKNIYAKEWRTTNITMV